MGSNAQTDNSNIFLLESELEKCDCWDPPIRPIPSGILDGFI